jgi:hypothetical protein
VGNRLRYGDAMALYASLMADPSSMTGAKHLGLDYPMSWEGLSASFHQRGYLMLAPLRIGEETGHAPADDEELEQAKAKLSPFPGVNVEELP